MDLCGSIISTPPLEDFGLPGSPLEAPSIGSALGGTVLGSVTGMELPAEPEHNPSKRIKMEGHPLQPMVRPFVKTEPIGTPVKKQVRSSSHGSLASRSWDDLVKLTSSELE